MLCAFAAAAAASEVLTCSPTVMTRSRLGNFTAVPVPEALLPLPDDEPDDVPPAESCFSDSGACACPAAGPRAEEDALAPLLPPLHAVSASGPAITSASTAAAEPARRFPPRMSPTIRAPPSAVVTRPDAASAPLGRGGGRGCSAAESPFGIGSAAPGHGGAEKNLNLRSHFSPRLFPRAGRGSYAAPPWRTANRERCGRYGRDPAAVARRAVRRVRRAGLLADRAHQRDPDAGEAA